MVSRYVPCSTWNSIKLTNKMLAEWKGIWLTYLNVPEIPDKTLCITKTLPEKKKRRDTNCQPPFCIRTELRSTRELPFIVFLFAAGRKSLVWWWTWTYFRANFKLAETKMLIELIKKRTQPNESPGNLPWPWLEFSRLHKVPPEKNRNHIVFFLFDLVRSWFRLVNGNSISGFSPYTYGLANVQPIINLFTNAPFSRYNHSNNSAFVRSAYSK